MLGVIAGKWVILWKILVVLSTPTESGLVFGKFEIEPNGGFFSEERCEEFAEVLIEKSKKYPESVEYWVCVSYREYVEDDIIYY